MRQRRRATADVGLRGAEADGGGREPLSLVHAGHLSGELDDLPVTNGHTLAGLRAGCTGAESLVQHASARDLAQPDSLIRDATRLSNGGVGRTRRLLRPGSDAESAAPSAASCRGCPSRGGGRVVQVDVTTDRVRRAAAVAVRAPAPGLPRLPVAAFEGADAAPLGPYPGW